MATTDPRAQGGERRVVTVLFADIVGSTALTEAMDPEDWTAVVNEAFAAMTAAVARYEGTVARLMGDGVLAFFGAPVAHEDDPERAARAALDMIGGIDAGPGARLRRERGLDLRIRAGLSTGEVVVGTVGAAEKREYTAMGDAVNLAARMQAAAAPGTVLASEATHRAVAGIVEATDLGPLEVKGKSAPVRAFEITGFRRSHPLRGIPGADTPLVGRADELARLAAHLAVVRAGAGRVATLVGDAGIGKSRLIAELRGREAPGLSWYEGRCLSYGAGLPYHLAVDLLRSLVGAAPAAEPRELAAATERVARDLLGDEWADAHDHLGLMAGFRSAEERSARVTALDFEVTKRFAAAMFRLLRASAERRPAVVVCEDVHWADPSSVSLLTQLLPLLADIRVLLVLTSRPERDTAGWELVAAARALYGEALLEQRLAPLSDDESGALVGNLLDPASLPDALRRAILAKAEGNPFFVEEVIRMLVDRGAVVRDGGRWAATGAAASIAIPDSLQALLLARIDRLPDGARRAIRTASVIGRQFPVRVLERLLEPADAR